ncbi:MAG TPA: efflux RND transporter periplasmic adaptor subunit [Candidatus Competibacteraceae bacterium]|nr:efflux RND transporter periplasmic adaptor subunit [Candidatus Competibacteraceae bacterium]
MAQRHPVLSGLLTLGALLSAAYGTVAAASEAAPTLPFATLEVQSAPLPRERIWDGVVEAADQATLSAQTAGRVLELPYDVNDYVRAGDVVVRFTDVEQQAELRRAQAALDAAQAAATEAEAEYRRFNELFERKLVARAQLDQAIARREAARAQLEAAQAAVRAARQQLDYTVVRAPYSGILTQRHVEVGEAVQPGQALVSGLSLNRLRLRVELPQSEITALREQAQARVQLDDGRWLDATRVVLFPYADPATHSFRVRVELPEAETGLMPGMIAKVAFALGTRQPLRVPVTALVRRSEVTAVYVLGADDRVSLRQIRPGHRFGDQVEVLAGLRAGERIAADPAAALTWLVEQRREVRHE